MCIIYNSTQQSLNPNYINIICLSYVLKNNNSALKMQGTNLTNYYLKYKNRGAHLLEPKAEVVIPTVI